MNTTTELINLKNKIEKMRTEILMEKGNLERLYSELTEDFHFQSSEEARKKADQLYSRADSMKAKLEKKITEVKNEYRI